MINFVNKGSEITRIIYSAAKRNIRTLSSQLESLMIGGEDQEPENGPITFSDSEIDDQHHDDAFVISIILAIYRD